MRHWRYVANAAHFKARSLKRPDSSLSAAAGTANQNLDASKAMLLGEAARLFGGNLRCERSALSASLKVNVAGACPADNVALRVSDGDKGVVERCVNVSDTHGNVLLFLYLAFSSLLSCHKLLLLSLLLTGNRLLGTLADSSVAAGVLSSGREATSMPQSSIGTDFDQPSDVALYFASQVAFHLEVTIDDFAEMSDLGFGKVLDLLSRIDLGLSYQIVDIMLSNAIQQRKCIEDRFLAG